MSAERPGEEPGAGAPNEEELRARLEEELRKIKVRDVLVQTVVTLINLGGQRLGVTETSAAARDLDQTRLAIEAVRSLLPLLETDQASAEQVRPVRDALAQLQMAYARETGGAAEGSSGEAAPEAAEQQATPQTKRSGGLWVPPGSSG